MANLSSNFYSNTELELAGSIFNHISSQLEFNLLDNALNGDLVEDSVTSSSIFGHINPSGDTFILNGNFTGNPQSLTSGSFNLASVNTTISFTSNLFINTQTGAESGSFTSFVITDTLNNVTVSANVNADANSDLILISSLVVSNGSYNFSLTGNLIYNSIFDSVSGTINSLALNSATKHLTLSGLNIDFSNIDSANTFTEVMTIALSGNDLINGTSQDESLYGYAGNDTLSGNAGNDNLSGGDGDDILNGNLGDDFLYGNIGNDQLLGGQGNDQLFGGQGNDILTGALGDDSLAGALGDDTLKGGQGNDQLLGGQGNDTLLGALGNDSLTGALGNDTFSGGDGNDTLTGGGGLDTFVFDFALNATTNVDTITDFVSGSDKIQLSASIFTALGAGVLNANDFVSGAGASALDASDRILYDTNTGSLYYDADGSASGAKVLFATLTANPSLVAADVSVV